MCLNFPSFSSCLNASTNSSFPDTGDANVIAVIGLGMKGTVSDLDSANARRLESPPPREKPVTNSL